MDIVIDLLEVEHHQIGRIKQFIDHRIVTTHKAVGVEAGMDTLGGRRETSRAQIQPAEWLHRRMPSRRHQTHS